MDLKEIKKLLETHRGGEDDIENGIVVSKGYIFLFRNYFEISKFIENKERSTWIFLDRLKGLSITERYYKAVDYISSLKTIIPKMKLGLNDDEPLYDAWVFIKIPDGREYLANFSNFRSRTVLDIYLIQEFYQNKDNMELSDQEKSDLGLKFIDVLDKVPRTNFKHLYYWDGGTSKMKYSNNGVYYEDVDEYLENF